MKPGLRVQILLLLGGLLLIAFVPLFFAIATYTRVSLEQLQHRHARALGRAIAAHVGEARATRSAAELGSLLDAQVGGTGVSAILVYDAHGSLVAGSAEDETTPGETLPKVDPTREAIVTLSTRHGPALGIVVPSASGAVVAILRTDAETTRTGPLLRLVALYTSVIALALLVLAYFALTRFIVRPLDAVSAAAQRVASGARRLEVPTAGAHEIAALNTSLKTMTETLLQREDELRRKIDEIEHGKDQLATAQNSLVRSERLASVGRLAAGLAHEVGNPLTAIIGLLDMLLEGGLDPDETQDFLSRMRRESERVNKILRDLLEFARPTERRDSGPVHGNVEAAVFDTVTLISPQASYEGIDLEVDVFPELPLVRMGQEQLVQILLNLLLNAADACGGKGKVRLTARLANDRVELAVADDGPGIAPEVIETLFEPFVTTKEVGKGTGLGLAVCRGLVEAEGGTIRVDETVERGARFVIELEVVGEE